MDRARAELKAKFATEFTAQIIQEGFPALARKMHVRTAVLNWASRNLELIGN